MLFNINDYVKIRLNEYGKSILKKNHAVKNKGLPIKYKPPEEDIDGYSEWQLWCFMAEFGEHMYNGCTMPFETIIKIVEPEKILKP
jgi:hypothetical protein